MRAGESTPRAMSSANGIEKLVRRACDGTSPSVDEDAMRAIKRAAKADDNALKCAHEALMRVMASTRSGAATRAHAVTATSELFTRSRLFRELTMDKLEIIMKHAVGTDDDFPLPDVPKGEADRLRQHAVSVLDEWERKFKNQYKQLTLARKFVTERLGEDAPEVRAERARVLALEKERQVQRNLQRQWLSTKGELPALLREVRETLHAAGECFCMLFGDTFETILNREVERKAHTLEDDADETWEDVADGAADWRFAQEFGDDDESPETTSTTGIALRETDENAPIIEQLRGLYRSTKARYLACLTEVLQILGRIQPEQITDDGVVVISQDERLSTVNVVGDLKQLLTSFVGRCETLRLIRSRGGDEGADPNANTPSKPEPSEPVDDGESRRDESNASVGVLLDRAAKRLKRGVAQSRRVREATAKRESKRDIGRRAQQMLASQIRAHNDEVLAEAGLDFFEMERRKQNTASEAKANEIIEEEIERREALEVRGKTARQRIEKSLRQLRRQKNRKI